MKLLFKSMLFWLPMVAIGFLNGTFRAAVLMHFMDEAPARRLSALMLIILLAIFTKLIYPRLDLQSPSQAAVMGFAWMLMTMVFETVLGIVGSGMTWSELAGEYNVLNGKFWPFVLLSVAMLPVVMFKLTENKRTHARRV